MPLCYNFLWKTLLLFHLTIRGYSAVCSALWVVLLKCYLSRSGGKKEKQQQPVLKVLEVNRKRRWMEKEEGEKIVYRTGQGIKKQVGLNS